MTQATFTIFRWFKVRTLHKLFHCIWCNNHFWPNLSFGLDLSCQLLSVLPACFALRKDPCERIQLELNSRLLPFLTEQHCFIWQRQCFFRLFRRNVAVPWTLVRSPSPRQFRFPNVKKVRVDTCEFRLNILPSWWWWLINLQEAEEVTGFAWIHFTKSIEPPLLPIRLGLFENHPSACQSLISISRSPIHMLEYY
jgi:hypothetical protein